MDYRVVEQHDGFLSVREPTAAELKEITAHPRSKSLVWVRIGGVLREDLGTAGFNRLLEAVGVHLQAQYAEELAQELVALDLQEVVCFIRGKAGATEISIDDPSFPDGETHKSVVSVASALPLAGRDRGR